MDLPTVFVTVGTTRFDSLVETVTSSRVLEILRSRSCTKLVLQRGSGQPVNAHHIRDRFGIEVEQYKFKLGVHVDIANADLIIGHAGAGTCMDILNNNKLGLLVVNTELMNNHQMELVEQLALDGYLYYCTAVNLAEQLETLNCNTLKPYMKDEQAMQHFIKHLTAIVN